MKSVSRPSMPGGPVASAERIIAFYQEVGTLPRVTAARDSDEGELYRALKRMRILQRQGRFDPEAASLLDAGCPGWANGRAFGSDRLWQERRDQLVDWAVKNGRLPHPSAGDETERSLASLVAAYRKHALHGRHPERIKELNELIPGWAGTPEWVPQA
ncbi:helicase associated domain-containing protein [Paenarthrobacter ureafaciens]|uniref:helicase associated domain-containing protein n=1 Tax=Paenarthrobacter ureafaciens TaxID=37931 RepID=UPI002DB656B8|nr:helicase associated domain-containing protein [Paenarthrobacter ureafaciens]MEC3853195.1 helicase associated domain-containing protein [Paenarthrobacter ureafaciens]